MSIPPPIQGWLDPHLALQYLDGQEDAVVVVDALGDIRECNPAFVTLSETPRDQLIGVPVERLDDATPEWSPFVQAVIRLSRAKVARHEVISMDRGAEDPETYLLTGIPIATRDGEPLIAVQVEDISDVVRERADSAARQMAVRENARSLERLNSELESFSYSVAHDLRAPLRFIDKFAFLLIERHGAELAPAALDYARQIREGSREMAQLVEDLLRFSRVTGQDLERKTVAMNDLAENVLEDIKRDLEEGRRATFTVGPLGTVEADAALVRQVLWNLLANAVKFTRARRETVIELTRADNVFTVSDNGVGFDADQAERLFTVFRRFHAPEDYEGSGVGLAIVQRVASRHGGRVWAESRPGEGARFHFTLEPGNEPAERGHGA